MTTTVEVSFPDQQPKALSDHKLLGIIAHAIYDVGDGLKSEFPISVIVNNVESPNVEILSQISTHYGRSYKVDVAYADNTITVEFTGLIE